MLENNPRLINILITSLLIIAALEIRISYIQQTEVYLPIRTDARYYYIYAQNLINHGIFSKEMSDNPTPDSFWSPGYPALLATNIYIFGKKHFYQATLFLQALLGALTVGMVYNVGLFFLPRWASIIAALLTTCSPHLISLGGYLLTETLFAFTLISFILLYIVAIRTKKIRFFAASGALAGISYLVNPVIFFAPFILAGLFSIRNNHHRPPLMANKKQVIIIFLSAFMMLWVSWTARCYLNVPVTAASAKSRALNNFIIGAHHDFYEFWRTNRLDPKNPATVDQQRVNGSWSEFLHMLGRRISNDPWHYTKWYLYEKPKTLWSWDILVGAGDIYVYPVITSWFQTSKLALTVHSSMKAIHGWLIFLCFLGGIFFLKNIRRNPDQVVAAIYTLLIYVSAVYVILQAEPRYSIPLRPFLYLGAMFGLWQFTCLIIKFFDSTRIKKLQRQL